MQMLSLEYEKVHLAHAQSTFESRLYQCHSKGGLYDYSNDQLKIQIPLQLVVKYQDRPYCSCLVHVMRHSLSV